MIKVIKLKSDGMGEAGKEIAMKLSNGLKTR